MRIEIKNEHCTGACVERRMGSEDKAVERAVSRSAGSTRMVKSARERPKNAAGAECLPNGSHDSSVRGTYHFPEPRIPIEALGLGQFARVTSAHRVHVFGIVHAAERSDARRLGCDELNTCDGLARE